jgi:uncharacterized protein with PhoU and TrkA domain
MDTITISGRSYDEKTITKEKEEYIRLEAVDLSFALSRLVYDKSSLVRTAVARKKVGHNLLVNDESWRVRATVAQYTNKTVVLDQLTHDENDFVRYIIVKRGHNLEAYLNDPDEEVASIARYLIQQRK